MKKLGLMLLLVTSVALVAGCDDDSTTTTSEAEQVRQEMSQENYEDAMIKAGRGDELEKQKAADAARMSQPGQEGS